MKSVGHAPELGSSRTIRSGVHLGSTEDSCTEALSGWVPDVAPSMLNQPRVLSVVFVLDVVVCYVLPSSSSSLDVGRLLLR
ncbi:hypothetical protein GW17_00000845 [Ensete ventricosum]|nr:hypothetical protein GW17_00000845 [Ensete ventricosum]